MKEKKPKNNLLVENEETQVEILEGENNYHKARFLVTTVDERNRNGRVYEKALAQKEQQMRFEGRVLGQSQHPTGEPNILDQFIIWEQAILDGDKEFFVARIAPTQKGKDFIELAKAGAMVSVSRRGTGTVREGKDKYGKKAMIVETDSYVLQGVDVLYPNFQSDPNAHMIHFESVRENETNMEELTLEQLREERGDLVEEITKPLEEKVAELEQTIAAKDETIASANTDFDAVNTKLEAATILAQEQETKLTESQVKIGETVVKLTETETKLAEATTKLAEVSEQFAALGESAKQASESVNALTEQLNVAKQERDQLESKLQAQAHLREKVKGEKAAWFILEELVDVATVAEVDAKFEQAKQNGDKLIENLGAPQGRAVYQGNENQELTEEEKKDEKQTSEVYAASKRIANHTGIR